MKKSFKKMSKCEKKTFLSMDLAERMMRIEQRVCAKFHKPILYNQTEYYKSMSPFDRQEFEKFRKNKRRKILGWIIVIILPLLLFYAVNSNITGNIISASLDENFKGIFSISVLGLLIVLIFIGICLLLAHRRKKRLFDKHAIILEKALSKKQ